MVSGNNKKLYVNRLAKRNQSLGEIFNKSDDDIVDLNIVVKSMDENLKEKVEKGLVINTHDNPVLATPFEAHVLKRRDTLYIYNFPRKEATVTVEGKVADSGEKFQYEFKLPPKPKK